MTPTPLDMVKGREISQSPQRKKRRKPRRPKRKLCLREGCPRPRREEYEHCSLLCYIVASEQTKAEAVCRNLGNSPEATGLWLAVVGLGDALSDYLKATSGLWDALDTNNNEKET